EKSLIPAGGYLVVTNSDGAQELSGQGVNVASINLPSLTNSGDVITVLTGATILREINYTEAWYNDSEREDGGYSIEYVGGGADAGCSGSWKSSEDTSGGTPGRENSVLGRMVDASPPQVTGFNVTESLIEVFFDEEIDPDQFTGTSLFALDNDGSITSTTVLAPATATLAVDIEPGIIYTLSILPDFSDCSGNFPTEAQTFQLAIPADPEPGDVVINELLFNPASGGSDFLELYNCSEKVFQIEGWTLRNTLSTSQTSAERTVAATRLFLPGEYLTLTTDAGDLATRYFDVDPFLLVEQSLPSLPNDEGNITVLASGVILDAFDYSADLHSELISDDDGVSLERLRQKSATQDANNWFSAAQTENFGTPTRANSQQRDQLPPAGEQTFSLVSQTFSPDGDSFEDLLELQYLTDRPGFVARIRIFDAQGRPIRTLRQVELLAGAGTIRWDGSNDEGRRAKSGAYILFIELFNPDGEVREEKLTAVLAGVR
ncbi:MAG: lamin tail domain-containing protein, partial [Bacteroidota bacterium]